MKTVNIPVALFLKNRDKLSHVLKPRSLAILHANDEMNRSAEQYFPYRQDNDLFYLTGINQEKTILFIAPDHPDKAFQEVLFILRPNQTLDNWEGHKLTPLEAQTLSGIKTVKFLDEYESLLASFMLYADQVYLNLPELQKFIPELPVRNLRFAMDLK